MKVFVTGFTGSIGQHLVKLLTERGYTVHALVRSIEYCEAQGYKNIVFFKGDILDKLSIQKAMMGCEQVYHLAAFAKVWAKNSDDFYHINVEGTVNVLEAAAKIGIKKVVVTSTAGVFGPSITTVISEKKIRELPFFNEYEDSKAKAEIRIKEFVNHQDLNVVIVSPSRVYGPFFFGPLNSTTFLIDKFVNHKWRIYPGTGKEIGNYVYIEDVALGHILAMEKGKKGETYILGGENHDYISFFSTLAQIAGIKRKMIRIPISLQVIFAKVQLFRAEVFGKEPQITPKWVSKGMYNWELSPEKAIHELGLPLTPLAEGLKKTVETLQKGRKES